MDALPASRGHGDDHSIPFAESTDAAGDSRNDAHPFMPTDRGGIGPTGSVSVDVCPTDTAVANLDDNSSRPWSRIGEFL